MERRTLLTFAAGLVLSGCTTPDKSPPASALKPLTGTLAYRQRIAVPFDTVAHVRLVDVSRADAASNLLAEQRFRTEGRQVPLPFTLMYDPKWIDPRMSYAIEADLRAGDRVLFRTTTRHSVLTRAAPEDRVEILLEQMS